MTTHRFRLLLSGLALMVAAYPWVQSDPLESQLFTLSSSLLLIGALFAVSRSHRVLAFGALLGAPAVIADWAFLGSGHAVAASIGLACEAAFFLFAAAIIFGEVFRARVVTVDGLAGAACVYFMLGFAWTALYTLVESNSPGSFHLPNSADGGLWPDFLFYSFTTLTTLGYGDITPLSAQARSLATLESTAGVLYVAILVARLVGAYQDEPTQEEPRMRSLVTSLVLLAVLATASPARAGTTRVAWIADGPSVSVRDQQLREAVLSEAPHTLEFADAIRFQEELARNGDGTVAGIRRAIEAALNDSRVDLVVTTGPVGSHLLATRGALPKDGIAAVVFDAELQGLPRTGGSSGVNGLVYVAPIPDVRRGLVAFREIVPMKQPQVVVPAEFLSAVPEFEGRLAAFAAAHGFETSVAPVDGAEEILDRSGTSDALLAVPLDPERTERLGNAARVREVPSFSLAGPDAVRAGFLAASVQDDSLLRLARRVLLLIDRIQSGEPAGRLAVDLSLSRRPSLNLDTANAIGFSPTFSLLSRSEVIGGVDVASGPGQAFTLASATEHAVKANLDLAAKQRAVAAAEASTLTARSRLLPQVEVSATYTTVDNQSARAFRSIPGTNPRRELGGSFLATQILYDQEAWTGYQVERLREKAVQFDREALALDIALDGALAYLELLRAESARRVRAENLEVTRANLDLARVRVRAGQAGREESLRWQSQLAVEQQRLAEADVGQQVARLGFNRVLHRDAEAPLVAKPAKIEEYGFVYGEPTLIRAVRGPGEFQLFRDFIADEAARHAPEVGRIETILAARESVLASRKRAFWQPRLNTFVTGRRRFHESGTGSGSIAGVKNRDDWVFGFEASFDLLRGGAKFSEFRSAREDLRRLKLEKAGLIEALRVGIRGAFWEANGAYQAIAFSEASAKAARENYALIADRYGRGATGILDVLDAQKEAVRADEQAVESLYDFLGSLMRAQRLAGSFDFLRTPEEKQEFRERLAGLLDEGVRAVAAR